MIKVVVPWLPPNPTNGRKNYAITIAPFVFIRKEYAENEAVIAHEQVHLDQVEKTGWLPWYWKYIFNAEFRKQQEAEGYAAQDAIENRETVT